LERLARRIVLRPDVDWTYTSGVSASTNNPCAYLNGQDPTIGVGLTSSLSIYQCGEGTAVTAVVDGTTVDYTYTTHASWSTNQVKYANDGTNTWVGVPLYFKDGMVRVVTIVKANSLLPVVCCDAPDARLTQCRQF
jgi:hypothetical protein